MTAQQPTQAASVAPRDATQDRPLSRAIWAVLSPFWRTRAAARSYVATTVILGCLGAELWIAIAFNKAIGDLTGALVDRRVAAIWALVFLNCYLSLADTLNNALFGYLRQFVMIEWRGWMVRNLQERWLYHKNFYRLERDGGADNPDQRISDDTFQIVKFSTYLLPSILRDVLRLVGFASLLLSLGASVDLGFAGIPLRVPGGLLILAVLVAALGTVVVLLVGRPLVGLRVTQQQKDADLRFALASIRANAEQIALYGGEVTEGKRVRTLLGPIVTNWHRIMGSLVKIGFFGGVQGQIVALLAMIVGLQPYLRGDVDYGHVIMVGGAFMMTMNALNSLFYFIAGGDYFMWASAARRLDTFLVELSRPEVSGIMVTPTTASANAALLETKALALTRPDGRALANPGDLAFRAGERWMVQGESGAGKSTMMRAMAGLWPYGKGTVGFDPDARERTLFLPQKSYVPAGPLIDALGYPAPAGTFSREECIEALGLVRLDELVDHLDEVAVWQQRLSPGEQQRLAFARVFLHRPEVILLDEATSALDPGNEERLYRLLDERLSDALVISIAHRDSLAQFHDRCIRLDPTRGKVA